MPNLLAGGAKVHSEFSPLTNQARLNLPATEFMASKAVGIIKPLKSHHHSNMMTQGERASFSC